MVHRAVDAGALTAGTVSLRYLRTTVTTRGSITPCSDVCLNQLNRAFRAEDFALGPGVQFRAGGFGFRF